jgi:hypothetical protein
MEGTGGNLKMKIRVRHYHEYIGIPVKACSSRSSWEKFRVIIPSSRVFNGHYRQGEDRLVLSLVQGKQGMEYYSYNTASSTRL